MIKISLTIQKPLINGKCVSAEKRKVENFEKLFNKNHN